MKKFLSLFLCVLLLCTVFSACKSSSPEESASPKNSPAEISSQEKPSGDPLRLCADFGVGHVLDPSGGQEGAVKAFLRSVADRGGPTDVEIELIPWSGSERQTALNRIRVELMSGQGPDIFITNCISSGYASEDQALFQYPEQAMRRVLFLKLDDYIENAQFAEWDRMTPAVMDAGKWEDGQYLLPLGYSFPLSVFLSDDVQPYPASTTWAQVAEGNDPVLNTTARPLMHSGELNGTPSVWEGSEGYLSQTWKELADYDSETLLVSEEEILQRTKELLSLRENGPETSFPHFRAIMDGYLFHPGEIMDPALRELRQGIYQTDSMTMVPLYCDEGGAVAMIHTFAGINAGTKRPEDAFFVLDVLMMAEIQPHLALYNIWTDEAMTVNEDVAFGKSESVLAAFAEARSQLTSARFVTPLDALINESLAEYEWRKRSNEATEETLSELVSEAYSKMKKALDES